MSASTAAGALYFASEMTLERAQVPSVQVQRVLPDAGKDVACAALSRDGKRFAFCPSADELRVVSLPDARALWTIAAPLGGMSAGSIAFDPTAQRLAFARAGKLVLLNGDDGSLLSTLDAGADLRISHPDWSPDGRSLAVTQWPADAEPDEPALEGSGIARIPVAIDGTLAAPEALVAAAKRDETLAFPAYSRDGEWLAYVQLKGKLRDAKEASLWVVSTATGEPLALERARPDELKDEQLAVPARPAWLPSDVAGVAWLVFASSRSLRADAPRDVQQLWLTRFDGALAKGGIDPSSSALWLPFQDENAQNARPFFAPAQPE